MKICDLCLNVSNMPIKIICQHEYCFTCLKHNLLETKQFTSCPKCDISASNLNLLTNAYVYNEFDVNYVWLYSSNYNNAWWTYNSESNTKIEKIYKDYLLRQEILNSEKHKDNSIKLHVPKVTKKQVQIAKKPQITFDSIEIDDEFDNDFEDCVDFSEIDKIPNQTQLNPISPETPLSYIIKCGTYEYKIDFDLMKQINTIDMRKKRSIKRLIVPNVIAKTNMQAITSYLEL